MANVPTFETGRFAFHVMRVGSAIVRKRDNASVYFQPGDDTARAMDQVEHLTGPEAYPGENAKCFNIWCGQYFA